MKKITLYLFILLGFISVTTSAQDLFFEDFQSISLNKKGIGDLPSSWIMYNDSNTPYFYSIIDYSYMDKAWKVLKDEDNNKFAQSISYFKKPAQADRWMITPEIDLSTAKNPLFLFNARSGDLTKKENYQIRISPLGGSNKEDFTIVLKDIKDEGFSWTEHSFWLSEHKGKKIRLAFIENSNDRLLVQIDNIRVTDLTNKSAINVSALEMSSTFDYTDQEGIPIESIIRNMGQDTIRNYTMNYSLNGGAAISQPINNTQIFPLNTELAKGLIWHPTQKGYYTIRFWISQINGTNHTSDTVQHTLFVINKNILPPTLSLYEGFSSMTCSPCNAAKPYITEMFRATNANKVNSKMAATNYQMNAPVPGDPCYLSICSSRFFSYNLNGVPSFVVNGEVLKISNWQDIPTKIPQIVEETYSKGAPLSIEYTLERKDKTVTIHSQFINYKPIEKDIRYFVVFVEDSLLHTPDTDPKKAYFNVVRTVLPSIAGGIIEAKKPDEITRKTDTYTFNMSNPKIFSNLDSMSVIVFVQEISSKKIVQVCFEPSKKLVIETENKTENSNCKLYPNPATDMSTLDFTINDKRSIKINIFDMMGRCVYTQAPQVYPQGTHQIQIHTHNFKPGLYFVKMEGTDSIVKLIIQR